jgi:hypothetical protein
MLIHVQTFALLSTIVRGELHRDKKKYIFGRSVESKAPLCIDNVRRTCLPLQYTACKLSSPNELETSLVNQSGNNYAEQIMKRTKRNSSVQKKRGTHMSKSPTIICSLRGNRSEPMKISPNRQAANALRSESVSTSSPLILSYPRAQRPDTGARAGIAALLQDRRGARLSTHPAGRRAGRPARRCF